MNIYEFVYVKTVMLISFLGILFMIYIVFAVSPDLT